MRPWNNDVDYAASEQNCCGGRNLLVARNWPLRIICMTDQAFADLVATIIDRRRKQGLALIRIGLRRRQRTNLIQTGFRTQ
jgi:hypothetical protein